MAASSLITVAVSKKDSATYSKTLLLNTNRVLDMELTSSGVAEFWYDQGAYDLKNQVVKYTCTTYTVRNLDWAINRAATDQNRIHVHVMRERKSAHQEIVKDKIVKLYIDQVLFGYDKGSGLGSYIWVCRGNTVVRWETSHTIADLVRSMSKSASLSRSPMS